MQRGGFVRVLILSDSHGVIERALRAAEAFEPDMIIHLGDIERDVLDLGALLPDIPIEAVLGNNDLFCSRVSEKVVKADGLKIFITHGHMYSSSPERIALRALEKGCSLALFGHTHRPFDAVINSVRVFNPGSVTLPRGGAPTVGVLEVEGGRYGLVLCDWL